MPILTPDRLAGALAGGELGGVFFFVGDEEFLKEEAAAKVVEAHLDPATRDFNFDQLDGADLDGERFASLVQTPPMLAPWRVVVVREAQAIAGVPRLRSVVEEILDRPPPGLALLLLARVPERTTSQFYDRLRRDARTIEFAALSPADVPGWLMERAAADGVEMEPEAARMLAAAIGNNMGVLERELDKLRDYVGDRRRIGPADIRAVAGHLPRQNRWEWFDVVGAGRWREARESLPILLDSGETGVGIVMGLGTHFLRLAIAVDGGADALRAELPPHQRWLAARIQNQARRWNRQSIRAALEDLLRADRLLKSTSLSDLQVLEELLLRLESRASATGFRA